MDHDSFDRVSRLFGAARTRRAALGAVLAAAGGVGAWSGSAAKRPRKRKKSWVAAAALPGTRSCPHPKAGQNLSKCDFTNADLRGANLRGANLSGAHFGAADLCSADLRGANLHKTDFSQAVLTRVDFRAANLATATLEGAIFCQTRMPNGALDNRHCPPDGDVCCGDEVCEEGAICHSGRCLEGGCVNVAHACNIVLSTCCNGAHCRNVNSPYLTTCQLDCQSDADCPNTNLTCRSDGFFCPRENADAKCCLRKPCSGRADCPSGRCCAGVCCQSNESCVGVVCLQDF